MIPKLGIWTKSLSALDNESSLIVRVGANGELNKDELHMNKVPSARTHEWKYGLMSAYPF
jgi:hypothetical protein